jgi:hypothetical protein
VASDSGADGGGGNAVVDGGSVVCGWGVATQATRAPARNRESSIVLNKGIPFCLSDRSYRVFRIIYLYQDNYG